MNGKDTIKMANDNNGLLSMFIPNRRDTLGDTIRKYIFILSIVVIIVGGVIILCNLNKTAVPVSDGSSTTAADEQQPQDSAEGEETEMLKGSLTLADAAPAEPEKVEEPEMLVDYSALYAENNDFVGWIRVPNSPIDYPVMQAEDNKYYLTHDFSRSDLKAGSIFADYKVVFDGLKSRPNTILYGHNQADGSQFAKVTNYFPSKFGSLDFYLQNPVVYFDTVYEKGAYKVFAVIFVNTEEKDGEIFKYYKQREIKKSSAFYSYIENILDRSTFYTDVDLQYGDELLTLSTCYYPLGRDIDTRFVLFARKVREGESEDVDVSKAYINPSPLYFDTYYAYNGGSWAGRNWDTTKIAGYDEYLSKQSDTTSAN